jgi:transposase
MANQQAPELELSSAPEKRRYRSKAERRQLVEAAMLPGVSVARVARTHGVNANQVYAWRRLYERGLLDNPPGEAALLPVRITTGAPTSTRQQPSPPTVGGAIHIEFAQAHIQIQGTPDPVTLRIILERLLG